MNFILSILIFINKLKKMLLYCDNTSDNKVVSEIKKDSELYTYVSKLFTGLNLEKECYVIDDIPFTLIYLKSSDESEYLCRHYINQDNKPVVIYKETLENFNKDKDSIEFEYFYHIICEIYKVHLDKIVLDTIICYDKDREQNDYYNNSDDSIFELFKTFFPENNKFNIDFSYNYGYDFDFEKDYMIFFYDYNNNSIKEFEYYSSGVLNNDLIFKEPLKINIEKYKYLDKKEKYLNRKEFYIKKLIKQNKDYESTLYEKELKMKKLKEEIINKFSILENRELELYNKENELIKFEEMLINEEKALLDEENEFIYENKKFQNKQAYLNIEKIV